MIGNLQLQWNDQTKLDSSSTLLTVTASHWRYMKEMRQVIPQSWDAFKVAVSTNFIPFDHLRRTKDKVRKLVQNASVSKYLNVFCSLVLTIPNMNDGKKLEKFCAGLKTQVRLEVPKAGPVNIDDVARIVQHVDSAVFRVAMCSGRFQYTVPQPIDIGNVQGNS